MLRSQNGYSANDRGLIGSYRLPGGKVALRAGDVSVVLLWVAQRFHETVEPLRWPGVWGYAERTIRGSSTTLSNHASGTAIDLNAPQHPLGVPDTFSPAQVRAIRAILDHCEGVIRWGGDYHGRKDEMHFEVNAGAADVSRVAAKIRSGVQAAPPPPPPRRDEDPGMDIPLYVQDDLRFRAVTMAEAGGGSAVAEAAWVTVGSTWGASRYVITAIRHDGHVLHQWGKPEAPWQIDNNRQAAIALPPDTRIVTVEGSVEHADTLPAAALWTIPRR